MKFKIDENLPTGLVEFLRSARHDVETAVDEELSGATDDSLLRAAVAEARVLMTFDQDFGDVRMYPPGSHRGIVVFRLPDQRWRTLEPEVRALIAGAAPEDLARGLTIVQPGRVRRRTRPVNPRAR